MFAIEAQAGGPESKLTKSEMRKLLREVQFNPTDLHQASTELKEDKQTSVFGLEVPKSPTA